MMLKVMGLSFGDPLPKRLFLLLARPQSRVLNLVDHRDFVEFRAGHSAPGLFP